MRQIDHQFDLDHLRQKIPSSFGRDRFLNADRNPNIGVMNRIVRSKPKAKLKVADSAGGMLEVVDRRFDNTEWPISFQVPAAEAENWFEHLQFECERRGWSGVGMSQLQSRENSGSLMLLGAGLEKVRLPQ